MQFGEEMCRTSHGRIQGKAIKIHYKKKKGKKSYLKNNDMIKISYDNSR